MRYHRWLGALLSVLFLGSSTAASAQLVAPDVQLLVSPVTASASILYTHLGATGGVTIDAHGPALHGGVTAESDRFTYDAALDFWSLATDRFTYTLRNAQGQTAMGLVTLVALTPTRTNELLDFEDTEIPSPWQLGVSDGRFDVLDGLGIFSGLPSTDAGLVRHDISLGDGNVGGGSAGSYGGPRPPPPPPPGGDLQADPILRLMQAGAGSSQVWVEVEARQGSQRVRLHRPSFNGDLTGDWIPVGTHDHNYSLVWWPQTESIDGGVLFCIDGRCLEHGTAEGLPTSADFHLGVLAPYPLGEHGLEIDNISLLGNQLDTAASLEFVESFEDGSVAPATLVGAASVTTTGVLSGTRSLAVTASGAAAHLLALSPPQSSSWSARARVNFQGLNLPVDVPATLIDASALVAGAPGALKLQAKRTGGGALQVRIVATPDAGDEVVGAWSNLSSGTIELEWWASASPQLATGGARLWVNGQVRSELLGLDNDTRRVGQARIGLVVGVAGASGTLYFDNLQTWRRLDR